MAAAPVRRSELGDALRACRSAFIGVGVMSCMINLLYLTGSIFMLEVYDRVLPSRSVPTLIGLVILAAGLYAAQGGLDLIRGRILGRIGTALDEALNTRVFETVVRLPLLVGSRNEGLQPLRDLDNVRSFLGSMGPGAFFDLPWLPFYLAICFAFHWLLGVTALVGAVILVALTLITELLSRTPAKDAMTLAARRNDLAAASRRNAEVLVAMGMSGRLTRRWSAANETYLAGNQHASDIAGGLGAIAKVLRMMLQSAVLAVGAYLVIHQEATAGIIIAGSILSARALAPVDLAIAHWKGFVAARQSWHRLAKLLQQIPAANEPTLLQAPSNRLSVEAVSIVPPGEQRVIVQDINFAAEAGTGVGVIGPSGSGKSSLVRALVGVWMPARGKVRLDGAALDQWSSDVLGRHIGYLPQDVELFAGSVAQNICRFDPDAKSDGDHRRRQGGGRARDDHQDARGLRHPDRRAGHGAFGGAGPARGAGACALWQSVPDRARRAELQSRQRGRRGVDARGSRGARARRRGDRGRAPADRHRGGRSVAGAEGRPHAGVRSKGNRARPGAAAGAVAAADQDRVRSGRREKIMTDGLTAAHRSIRGHLIFGLTLILVLAVGFGGWASTAQISGALIAPGSVVVDSNVKKVQHPTGGVVGEVRVRDGDIVKAGDIVVRLDETVVKASLAIVVKTLNGLWARAARLEAEQRSLDKIKFPPQLTDRMDDPDVRDLVASETKLFEVRVFGRAGQKSQLRERVSQLNEEIAGLTAQEQAKEKEVALVEKELIGVRQLYEQRLVRSRA